jgi:lipopolysaccharide transport system ATP-binding protein
MPQPMIAVDQLSKRYKIGRPVAATENWRGALARMARSHLHRLRLLSERGEADDFVWALRDASFRVEAGEVVGIIGRNGAGKSTLLKLLSRIVTPTAGRAVIQGRVGSLLEVGTGFHPELSGRENIFLNGAILGMRRTEILRVFDAIVDFSGVGRFLDTPVKRYSSGMYVRLAFAVAAHLDPEVLLVDEVLAVGDVQFQKRCLGKMSDVARSGRTVLFVSHNMAAVEGLCQRGIVLEDGCVAFDGPVTGALEHYLLSVQDTDLPRLGARQDRSGNGAIRLTDLRFVGAGGATESFLTGQDFRAEVDYEATGALENVSLSIPFFTQLGQKVFMAWTRVLNADFARLPPRGTLVLEIPRLPLRAGGYAVNVWCEVNGDLADWVQDAGRFTVVDGDYYRTGKTVPTNYGHVVVDHAFHLEEAGVAV